MRASASMKLFNNFIGCGSNVANSCIVRFASQIPKYCEPNLRFALSPCFQCKIIIYYHTYDTNISFYLSLSLTHTPSLPVCLSPPVSPCISLFLSLSLAVLSNFLLLFSVCILFFFHLFLLSSLSLSFSFDPLPFLYSLPLSPFHILCLLSFGV